MAMKRKTPKASPRSRAARPRPEPDAVPSETMGELPGGVLVEEPVGAPHVDEEPGGIGAAFAAMDRAAGDGPTAETWGEEDIPVHEAHDAEEEEDPHALWARREEEHRRKNLRLMAVVGATMAGVAVLWAVSFADGIRRLAPSGALGLSIEREFLSQLSAQQRKVEQLSADVLGARNANANLPAGQAGAPAVDADALLTALKIKAAAAASTSSAATSSGR